MASTSPSDTLGLRLLNHMVVYERQFTSFADRLQAAREEGGSYSLSAPGKKMQYGCLLLGGGGTPSLVRNCLNGGKPLLLILALGYFPGNQTCVFLIFVCCFSSIYTIFARQHPRFRARKLHSGRCSPRSGL